MDLKEKVLKNVFSNWAGMGVNIVLAFILAPIVVHGLGNTWYGIWIVMLQLTGYLWLLDLGIRESVIRYVAKHHAEKDTTTLNQIVSTAVYLYLIISIVTVGISFLVALFLPDLFTIKDDAISIARMALIITGFNIAQGWFFNSYVGVLMGLQRYDIFNKVGIAVGIIRFFIIMLFLKLGYGIIALAVIQLVSNFLSNVIIYIQCKNQLPELKLIPYERKNMHFKTIANYSVFVFINNIGQKIIFYTDAIVIGLFLPPAAITFFAIPGNLVEYMRKIVMALTQVLNPLTSQLDASNDKEKIRSVFMNGTKFSVLIGLPIATVYLIMGKRFISLWIGAEYGEACASVLVVLTIAHLLSLVHYTIDNVLYGLGRHSIIAYLRILEAVLNLILSLILVKSLGIVGVALGTAIPHIILMVLILPVIVCKIIDLKYYDYFITSILMPFLAIVPFAAACYVVNRLVPANSLVLFFTEVFCLLPVYVVTVWCVTFNKNEKQQYMLMIRNYFPGIFKLGRT